MPGINQNLIAKEDDLYDFHLECIFSDILHYSNSRAIYHQESTELVLIVIHSDGRGGEKEVFNNSIGNSFSKKKLIETFLIETAKAAFKNTCPE